ncbi:hypothetical protein [Alicyclobacillus pomorum]|uniref:hypothetical protein n=1 Tax=Alicyclobacillus pomorum TaxID=204470 RepID=UPI00047D9E5B|nr:hypothetical protein [Alicyclobacillus pomorum]
MVHRGHCMPFIGQHVVFRTRDGIHHHGILHAVRDDGILVRPVGGSTTRLAAAAGTESSAALLQDVPHATKDIEEAWFPFFFFPFLALAFLSPWAWWW